MKRPTPQDFESLIYDLKTYKKSYMALWYENERLKNKIQKEQKKKILKWWNKQNPIWKRSLTPIGERGNFYDKLYHRIVVSYEKMKGKKLTAETVKHLRFYFDHP